MRCQDETAPLTLADRRISEWLFMLTLIACAYFYGGGGWNQNSQFDLTRAMVERHTFAIDAYAHNTGDVSRSGGHIYTNKSPGLSWLAAIPYALIFAAERAAGINPSNGQILTLNAYVCTVLCVALFAALVPALLYREGRRLGLTPLWSATVALIAALATQSWPYATLFQLHVPSGALMLLALRTRRDALSGFCTSAATAMNYLCAPALLFFALSRGRRGVGRFIAGAVPVLVLIAIYHHVCFGSAGTIGIAREDPRFLEKGAVMGIFGPPTLDALIGITVSAYRGFFFFAPVLVLALGGFIVWWKRVRSGVEPMSEPAAVLAISAVFFGFNLMFLNWDGGFGIGARYLVPLIPLWGLALLRCTGWHRDLLVALGVVSLVFNFTATAVDPQPSASIPRPLTQYLLPLLVDGRFSPNVPITPPWSAETFTGHTSVNRLTHDEPVVFLFHPPGSPVAEWASFNLGEPFFGAGDARSLIPIVAILGLGAAAILVRARREQSPSAATAQPNS